MTSNIDKLNQIAPLLAGRKLYSALYSEEGPNGSRRYSHGEGMFHSLEIDDVYPVSEPMVYFRATNVKWKHYDWNSTDVKETEEEFCELVFEIEMVDYIEQVPRQPWEDVIMEEHIIIQFRDRSEARLGFVWP